MTNLNKIDGDVAVGRNVAVGGDAEVRGALNAKGNVRIEGWLDAPHVKGVCRGLYDTEETLKSEQPQPRNGWWALVGEGFPLTLWRAFGGEWHNTNSTVEKVNVVGVELYDREVPQLRARADEHDARLDTTEREVESLRTDADALRVSDTEQGARLDALERFEEVADTQIKGALTLFTEVSQRAGSLELWRRTLADEPEYVRNIGSPKRTAQAVLIGFSKGSLTGQSVIGDADKVLIVLEAADEDNAGVMTSAQVRLLNTLAEHFDEFGTVGMLRAEVDSLNASNISLCNQVDELAGKLLDSLPSNEALVAAGYENVDEDQTAEEAFLRALYSDLLSLYRGDRLLSTDINRALELATTCPVKRFDAIVPTFEELRANYTLYEGLICYVSDRNCFIKLVDRFFPDYLTPEYNRKKGDDEWTPRADCVFLLGGRLYVWFNNALQYFVTNEEFEGLRVILEQAKGDTSVLRQTISALENAIDNQEERLAGAEVYGTQTRILLTQINERLSERMRLLSSESQELSKDVLGFRKDIEEAFDDINQCLSDVLSGAEFPDYSDDNALCLTTDAGEPLLTESETVILI